MNVSAPGADFSLSVSPASQSIMRDATKSYTVTVTALNGFYGTVSFGVTGVPSDTYAWFNPSTVSGSGNTSMRVSVGSSTYYGSYPLTITATSGSLSHSVSATLEGTYELDISATNPDTYPGITSANLTVTDSTNKFSLSSSPASQTVSQGYAKTYTAHSGPRLQRRCRLHDGGSALQHNGELHPPHADGKRHHDAQADHILHHIPNGNADRLVQPIGCRDQRELAQLRQHRAGGDRPHRCHQWPGNPRGRPDADRRRGRPREHTK